METATKRRLRKWLIIAVLIWLPFYLCYDYAQYTMRERRIAAQEQAKQDYAMRVTREAAEAKAEFDAAEAARRQTEAAQKEEVAFWQAKEARDGKEATDWSRKNPVGRINAHPPVWDDESRYKNMTPEGLDKLSREIEERTQHMVDERREEDDKAFKRRLLSELHEMNNR